MAKKPGHPLGDSTRAVHGGEREHQRTEAITTPIYQTSTFWFKDSEELKAFQEGRLAREEYGRYGNPTWKAVERNLCALEGAEETVLFASGMCAATTLFLALLPQGSHLIVTSDCYRRTRQFIREYLSRMGVETSVIDPSDTHQLADAIRDETKLFFTESPTNPYLRVIDTKEAVRVCHERGVKVVVDSTFATPINYKPIADGADLVVHSATKYLGGHNDLLAGAVIGSTELVGPVRDAVGVLGGITDAHSAWLLLRGLKTLALRMAARHYQTVVDTQADHALLAHEPHHRVHDRFAFEVHQVKTGDALLWPVSEDGMGRQDCLPHLADRVRPADLDTDLLEVLPYLRRPTLGELVVTQGDHDPRLHHVPGDSIDVIGVCCKF